MIVGDRCDIDRDVVLGDDFLRGDLHRDSAQRDAHHLMARNENEREARPAYAFEFSEKKYNTPFVLPQDANRGKEIQDNRRAENEDPIHASTIAYVTMVVERPLAANLFSDTWVRRSLIAVRARPRICLGARSALAQVGSSVERTCSRGT